MMLAIVGVVLVLMNRRQAFGRAEETLASLCSQLGLVPIQRSASVIKYFRELSSLGFAGSPQLATGNVEGLHMEICFVPVIKSAHRGQSMIGIRCRAGSGAEAGLVEHDPVRSAVSSLSRLSNSDKGPSRFGKYDAWGNAGDVARVFTTEVQAFVRNFPRTFDKAWVSSDDVVLVWAGIESDVDVVKQALRLGAAMCAAADGSVK
jgi:hypothetical protein